VPFDGLKSQISQLLYVCTIVLYMQSIDSEHIQGIATWWTGMDMPTPLLPETVSEFDADPITYGGA